MEAPEIPVIQEHCPAGPEGQVDTTSDMHTTPITQRTAATTAGLTALHLQLPAADPSGPNSRRWSLDEGSVHSDSWEVLSHGHYGQSHCGSSPRSVSPSDAYDSEVEAEAEGEREAEHHGHSAADSSARGRQQHASVAAALAAQPQQMAEADLQPFGSLVLDHANLAAAAAAEAAAASAGDRTPRHSSLEHGTAAAGAGCGSSAASSPRSSFERASNASRHDLYSLSQDGSGDNLSDHDSYIDDMMLRGEPDTHLHSHHIDHDHDAHSGEHDGGAALAHPGAGKASLPLPTCALGSMGPLSALLAAPAATLAAAVRGAYCTSSTQLRALAATFSAYLARLVPAGAHVAQHVVLGMAEIVGTLRECLPSGRIAGLGSMTASTTTALEQAAAAKQQMLAAVQRTKKRLGVARINWARVAMCLGVACGTMATLLWRSYTDQAKLSARLAQREGELAKLLMQVFELKRNITAHRSVPIIRHVSTTAGTSLAAWPAVTII